MAATKSKSAATVGAGVTMAHILWRPHNRALVLTAIVVVTAIGSALYAWRQWGEPATHSPEYFVTPERISVTQQPAWIQANVKAEVLRSLTGAKLELLDRELVEKVAHAFAMHPWVANVVRVEKQFPAHVSVELEYRRPVLVVKMDAPGEDGLLFLDEEGVLLPHADFTPSKAKDFLRIMAAGESPTSVYGTSWGSERIAGAARIAAVWGNRWQPLDLYWIASVRSAGGELIYELRTQDDKVRVVWGAAQAEDSSAQPAAEQKIAALEQHVRDKGPLGQNGAVTTLDLRELAGGTPKSTSKTTAHQR
jgi:hypothetical protein